MNRKQGAYILKNRDRGIKKWHGFFMPEHSGELKNIWQDDKKMKMPVLDEYQLLQFEEILRYAYEFHKSVELDIYEGGLVETKKGRVHAFYTLSREISLAVTSEEMIQIHFDEIMNVKIIDQFE